MINFEDAADQLRAQTRQPVESFLKYWPGESRPKQEDVSYEQQQRVRTQWFATHALFLAHR